MDYPKKMVKGDLIKFASAEHVEKLLRADGWLANGENTKAEPAKGQQAKNKNKDK